MDAVTRPAPLFAAPTVTAMYQYGVSGEARTSSRVAIRAFRRQVVMIVGLLTRLWMRV